MVPLKRFLFRLYNFLSPGRAERELERELTAHLTLLEDEFQRQGMSREEARRAARRAIAGIEWTKDLHRDTRSFVWLEDARRDVRHACRGLARDRGFATTVVVTLGLGIGANTAIFSVVNSVLLKPLPYVDSERLVRLMMNLPAEDSPTGVPRRVQVGLSAAEVAQLRSVTRTLSHVGTAGPVLVGLSGFEEAARLQGARVSSPVLQMIGVRPILGRLFDAADEMPGAEPVILIGFHVWQQYFGGDPAIVGRSLTLDAVLGPRQQNRYTIVGVLPDGLAFPGPQNQFWMPFQTAAAGSGPSLRGPMYARLADGISVEAASAEIVPIMREMRKGQRGSDRVTYEMAPEQDELVAPVRRALQVLTIAVGFVLLIACVNVANLIAARTVVRQREMAIRAALGAGRARVIRQLLTESLLLALAGGVLGTSLALGGIRLLRGLATTMGRFDLGTGREFPRLMEIRIDTATLLYTLGASLIVGLFVGLAPALRYRGLDVVRALGDGARSTDSGSSLLGALGMRPLLVVAQVTLAMVLLVGGGLLINSFIKLSRVDVGYESANVLTFQVALPGSRYPDDTRVRTFAEHVVARLQAVPGVQKAAYARQLPLVQLVDSFQLRTTPELPSQPPQVPPLDAPTGGDLRLVSADYLDVMGIRVVTGRGLSEDDAAGQPRVLLVNQALANRAFGNDNPIGKTVYVGRDSIPWQIVGVVANVRQFGLDREPNPQFFADLRQWPEGGFPLFPVGAYYVVRTATEPLAVVPRVRAIIGGIDAQAALFNVAPMESIVSNSISESRMYAVLLGTFALVGFALAVIGVYGVVSYTVTQRTREIGIRMALGAQRLQVAKLVLRQSVSLTALGVVLGLVGALVLTRYLEGLLFGLTPLDPATFVAVSLAFVLVAAVASYLPARRASRVDPLIALRCE